MSGEDVRQPNGREPNGGGNGGEGASPEQELEYRLLGQIEVLNFTANPLRVTPIGTTTLSWNVRPPPALHVPVSLTVVGQAVFVTNSGTSGSATAAPLSTTAYDLVAETAIVNRSIAQLTIQVNDADCKSPPIPVSEITSPIHDAIAQQLPRSSDFSLGSAGISVTTSNDIISINIPVSASGTDVSIAVQIEVGFEGMPPNATILARVLSVNVNIDTSTWDDIISLGSASACASKIEEVIEIFVGAIAENSIAPEITDKLNNLAQQLATVTRDLDSQHRTYALTSMDLTDVYFTIQICPLPNSSSQQVRPPAAAPIDGGN